MVDRDRLQTIERRIRKIEDQVEDLIIKKRDYEFQLGRALAGKSVGPACRSDDPDVMCLDCDCWKQTRKL